MRGWNLRGLSWWQTLLVVLPLVLIGFGGGLGGGIGASAAATNLSLARKPLSSAAKLLAMCSMCALAFGAFLAADEGVKSLWSPSSPSAPLAGPVSTTAEPIVSFSPEKTVTAVAGGTPQPIALNQPTVIHGTGPELSWPSYYNTTGEPGNDLAAYEVHRGTSSNFTPSAATLVATVNARDTTFVDTTAHAADYYYQVAVRTKSGQLLAGATQFVQLPERGQTELVFAVDAAATLDSGYPDTVTSSQFSLLVTPGAVGHGAERAIFEFGPLNALPADATVADARLSVWCNGSEPGPISVYALTRTFDASQATWNSASTGVAWTHPGGDYVTPPGSAVRTAAADPERCAFDTTSIVRGWSTSRGAEHGLLLRVANESPAAGYGNFSAGDTYFPGQRPELVVTYGSS